jgi:hypothetical protein
VLSSLPARFFLALVLFLARGLVGTGQIVLFFFLQRLDFFVFLVGKILFPVLLCRDHAPASLESTHLDFLLLAHVASFSCGGVAQVGFWFPSLFISCQDLM